MHRFLECYREFMQGLRWGPESSMEELDSRYTEARVRNYAPFMKQHEYLLDNFLINYCIRTVFPYGHREIGQRIRNRLHRKLCPAAISTAGGSLCRGARGVNRYVGISRRGCGRPAFGTGHAIKLVQSYAKAFLRQFLSRERAPDSLNSSSGIRSRGALSG